VTLARFALLSTVAVACLCGGAPVASAAVALSSSGDSVAIGSATDSNITLVGFDGNVTFTNDDGITVPGGDACTQATPTKVNCPGDAEGHAQALSWRMKRLGTLPRSAEGRGRTGWR
jgi:hypothetical protein